MNQAEFIKKFHAFLAESPPETAQIWCEFAGESVKRRRAHFRADEKWNASSVADSLDALYDGLCQTREAYSSELSTKVAALGLERCCLYPGEMLKAAECLWAGDSAKEIQAKIESGEFQCPDLFHTSLPKNPSRETCEMSNQEFIAHINTLIPAPNKEINGNLLDFGNSLWFELKEDLYNAFTFISRHFTPETLQSVYDLSGAMDQGSIIKDD